MTSPIDAALEDLVAEFDLLGDWEEQLQYVIDLGREMPPLADTDRSETNRVRGCASQVWLVTEQQPDGTLHFRGESDAIIVRGLIAVVLRLFDNRAPADILAFDTPAAFARLGLSRMLSMQRSNGLASMVARIRRDAEAAQAPRP
ncbi:MAG TPA: SufE family protein [Caulobacter sp.]|nr:SufE family protein [Caulobacter sp.]